MSRTLRRLANGSRKTRNTLPTVECLEQKQLLSFDPNSALPTFIIPSNVAMIPTANGPSPTGPSDFDGPTIRSYSADPRASMPGAAGGAAFTMPSLADDQAGSGGTSYSPDGSGGGSDPGSGGGSGGGNDPGSDGGGSGSGSGSDGGSGGDGGTGGGGSSSGSYSSWTSESSGSSGSEGSGFDGVGGNYTWSELSTWYYTWTWDTLGNTSWTTHTTNTYKFDDSGSVSGGTYDNTSSENDHSDGSGYSHSDGTSHSQGSSGEDASAEETDSDSSGDTYTNGGTFHSTGSSESDGSLSSSSNSSTYDSNSQSNLSIAESFGPDTEDDTGSATTKDHSDSNASWSNGVLVSSGSNSTHDDQGDETDSLDLGDSSGDTDDSGTFGEYTDHSESHSTGGPSGSTYTASSNSSDDGNNHDNVSLAISGSTDSYGNASHYSDTSQSGTAANGVSTSSYTHDDGGDDYEDDSDSDGEGDSEGGDSSDVFSDHVQGGTNPDGTGYSTWTSNGNGNELFSLNVVAGDNTLSAGNHDNYNYTASGGNNSSGATPTSIAYDENGGDDFNLHLDDPEGDSLDESGLDSFDEEDNNGATSETVNCSSTFNEEAGPNNGQNQNSGGLPSTSLTEAMALTEEKLTKLQAAYASQIAADAALSQAYATAAANFQALSNTNVSFNFFGIQADSIILDRARARLAAKVFKNGAAAIATVLREAAVACLDDAGRLRQSLMNVNTALITKIKNP
jgi:hypothetical protein